MGCWVKPEPGDFMGAYKYIKKSFQKSYKERSEEQVERLKKWRKARTVERTEKPANIVRARELGYKAKKGFVVARVKIRRGKRVRKGAKGGRKPGRNRKTDNYALSGAKRAIEKAKKKFKNLKAINAYWIGEDGMYKYYEVIMADPGRPEIYRDKKLMKSLGIS